MKKKLLLPTMLIFIFIVSVIFTFLTIKFLKPGITDQIANKILSLGLKEVVAVVREAKCKKLEEVDGAWIVRGCKDNIYIKIFFDRGAYAVYCYDSTDKREIFKRVARLFTPPQSCLNESLTDFKISDETWEDLGFEVYYICGRKIIMKDDCVMGVA